MNELTLVISVIVVATGAFVWLALTLRKVKVAVGTYNSRVEAVKEEMQRIFTDDFREELRNRGRLSFEKIINENAMFLKQDLSLTASQLNEYMQSSLKKVLKEEFEKYKLSITDAKEAALQSITGTQEALEQQRVGMMDEFKAQVAEERKRSLANLDTELSQIANHYILEVLAEEVDLSSQGEYIFANLESHKADIIQDIADAG